MKAGYDRDIALFYDILSQPVLSKVQTVLPLNKSYFDNFFEAHWETYGEGNTGTSLEMKAASETPQAIPGRTLILVLTPYQWRQSFRQGWKVPHKTASVVIMSVTFPTVRHCRTLLTVRGIHIHQDFCANTIGGILQHPTIDLQARFEWWSACPCTTRWPPCRWSHVRLAPAPRCG